MGQSVSVTALSAGSAGINVKELEDLSYEKTLSSARFMKCIRARHKDGLVVVKVAMRPPPDFKLTKYADAIKRKCSKETLPMPLQVLIGISRRTRHTRGRAKRSRLPTNCRNRELWISCETIPP